MREKTLLTEIGEAMPIIDYLIENKGIDYTQKGILDNVEMPRSMAYKHLRTLKKNKILKKTGKYGEKELYTLNTGSKITKCLLKLYLELTRESLDQKYAEEESKK